MEFLSILQLVIAAFTALVGFPAFLTALVNLLKYFRVIPDGAADKVVFWGNVLAFVGVGVAVFLGKTDILSPIDQSLSGLSRVLVEILAILSGGLFSMIQSRRIHEGLRGLPVVGYSYSEKRMSR